MGEIQEVNSAGQIDQLNALRFEMQSVKFNLSRANSEGILENEMPGMRNGIPKAETYIKYGGASRGVGIEAIENMAHSGEYHSRKSRTGSLIGGRFVYTVGDKPISSGHTKAGAYVGENRK